MTFSPVQRLWGLVAPNIQVKTSAMQAQEAHSFRVSLAGGSYDVYVEPFATLAPSASLLKNCVLTPQLFRNQDLGRSTSLKLSVAVPKRLELTVRFVESQQNLDGWRADMIESVTGRVVSSTVELKLPTRLDGSLVYSFGIDYVPVWGDDPSITHGELVRLSPPSGVAAPSLYFWREGLEWASPGSGVIDRLGAFPATVSVSGTVSSGTTQVPANVTFTAKEIASVSSGLFPSFIRSVQTDEHGAFNLDLLPGTYKVIASPLLPNVMSRPFAVSSSVLTVLEAPEVQAGTTLTVAPSLDIQGLVRTPGGEPARGAVISAEVSPARVGASIFDRAVGDLPALPRPTTAYIDESGGFHLFAEPDVYDFSVRPPASAGFAWLVMPGFAPPANANPDSSIGLPADLFLPAPVPIELRLGLATRTNARALLAGAAVRAYALLDATGGATTDPKAAVSAVRVAEGRVDGDLHATLMLPAKLDRPPEGFSRPAEPAP
jgi:hypothetical protein